MSVRESLRRALSDFYRQSWRFALLNAAFSVFAAPIIVTALLVPPTALLLLLVGPLAAALMHCAVRVAQGEDIRLRDALVGLRLHWRRGLVLSAGALVVLMLGGVAIVFYGGSGSLTWPLSIVVLYLLISFAVVQLALWPLAVFERERAFSAVARDAGLAVLRRPAAFTGLALALLVVNLLGAAAAILPLLTLTIAYSFLAAAHFALPRPTHLEA